MPLKEASSLAAPLPTICQRHARSGGLAVGLLVAVATSGAAAAPLEAELPRGKETCWERRYDEAHLLARPGQKISAIGLSKQVEEPGSGVIAVTLLANLRKRALNGAEALSRYDYAITAFCKAAGAALSCENEYGLGRFRIERAGKGLMIRNPGTLTFNPSNYDSEDISDNAVKVSARPDDAVWLLETRGPAACPW